jgi:hypothetical protein
MLDSNTLKTALKGDLITLFTECKEGEGITEDEYAEKLADLIATRVIEHITQNAAVAPGLDWIAGGQYPVAGSASGMVS